ncbi:hypothetical protein GCM10009779_39220 [Polymorphospora rubra]|uniref:Uncharacterized protein n=1 Tax=Polymorphospora rubra TaxID=338584 RepID=A0A810MXT0_9ACTN|nr:hypothetical protein Prubr_29780 [Polymorphospora rubra]
MNLSLPYAGCGLSAGQALFGWPPHVRRAVDHAPSRSGAGLPALALVGGFPVGGIASVAGHTDDRGEREQPDKDEKNEEFHGGVSLSSRLGELRRRCAPDVT